LNCGYQELQFLLVERNVIPDLKNYHCY